jgi:hypothetical protein
VLLSPVSEGKVFEGKGKLGSRGQSVCVIKS